MDLIRGGRGEAPTRLPSMNICATGLLSILLLVCGLVGDAKAASCTLDYKLSFKPAGEVGIPSFITTSNAPVAFRRFTSMPPIVLFMRYVTATATLIDLTLDGTVVQALPVPDSMRLGGDTVQLYQGVAVFQSLQVQSILPNQQYTIMFVITVPNGTSTARYNVSTGPLVEVTNPNYNSFFTSLRFGSYGWLIPSRTSRTVPSGGPAPPFTVELVDPLGFVSSASATITVSFGPPIAGQGWKPNAVIASPATFTALSGTATVSLNFSYGVPGTTPPMTVMTLSANNGSTRPVTLTTDLLKLGTLAFADPQSNYFMGFDPAQSFFAYENIGNTAVLNVPLPPVVINLYTSQYLPDSSSTGQYVILAAANGATLQGNAALVLDGVATFTDLVFTGPSTLQSAVITFTCNQPLAVSGVVDASPTIYSGTVTVTVAPIKSTHIVFHPASDLQSGGTNTFIMSPDGSFQISNIVILMKDSGYQSDYTASGAVFQLYAPLLNFSIGTSLTATMAGGIAVFSSINIVACTPSCRTGGPYMITVIGPAYVQSSLTASVTVMLPLPTGCTVGLDVLPGNGACGASTAQYSLQFLSAVESYVHQADQNIFGTVGSPLPEVRLALFNQASMLVDLDAAAVSNLQLYAFTDSAGGPSAEKLLSTTSGANIGVWKGRYFSFGCLLFENTPSGLPKIQFAFGALDPATGKIATYASPANRTGFVTVVTNPTSNFGLTFAPDWSLIQYEGQGTSGVLFVTLPTIQLQIVDSLHTLDTSGQGIVVSATSSGGNIASNGAVTFVSGVANFTSLRFQTVAANPVITFTVSQSAPYAVAGASVVTGPIALTATYIRNYNIRFKRLASCPPTAQCVVRNNQPFTFASMSSVAIFATIIVEDSSHQQEQVDPGSSDPEQTVTVTAISPEAGVDQGSASVVSTTTFKTSSEGSLTIALSGYNPAYASSKPPIYIIVTVTGGAPTLVGQELVIGPITVGSGGGSSGGSCTTTLNAPQVVANFYMSLSNFTASINKTVASIAQLLGIEKSRVHIRNYSTTAGIDPGTKRQWVGTKATLQFDDPSATSANRASSAALAAQFVALRPDCQQTPLPLANVYVENPNYGCNPALFLQGVNLSKMCTLNGDNTQCACYNDFLIDPYGVVCVGDFTVRASFQQQCALLSTCLENSIKNVCSQILVSQGNRYVWAFGAFGGLVGAVILGYFVVKKVVFRPSKMTLSRQDK